MWRSLAGTRSKIKKNPDYYKCLSKLQDKGLEDFTGIIGMDVKRTHHAIRSEDHAKKLTNVLLNYSKRNCKVGYCQGLNMLVSYLLYKGLSEEESFWMLCHLIEEVLPREYYTTMISLTADINIILLFLRTNKPKVYKHIRSISFELPMVLVELFITVFSTNPTSITDIIFDMVMIEGSLTYFKAILVFFNYFEKEIMQKTEFSRLD